MKHLTSSKGRAGLWLTCICAALPLLAVTPAGADAYRYGGSVAVIEQSGESESRITHYHDGHKIVTRDGSNTDITIQRGGQYPVLAEGGFDPQERAERFERDFAARFSHKGPWAHGDSECFGWGDRLDKGAFRQRTYERMREAGVP